MVMICVRLANLDNGQLSSRAKVKHFRMEIEGTLKLIRCIYGKLNKCLLPILCYIIKHLSFGRKDWWYCYLFNNSE
jgi:hypothetical protein